ncbi:MAG: nucleoside deaminase, partial [Mucinivorans sp.]
HTMGTFSLKGCVLYSSCEPCPMCLGAAYWAGIEKIYFGNSRTEAKAVNFDDSFIYDQIPLNPKNRTIPSEQLLTYEAIEAFHMWQEKEDKVEY